MRRWLARVLAVLVMTLPVAARAQTPAEEVPWLVEGDVACPRIALVFNIGIGELPSMRVLQTLIEKEVPATMFPMGSFARSQPDYLRRLAEAGFEIGTHGDTSLWLTDAPQDAIRDDIRNSVDAIERVIGRPIDPYHTPYAANTDERIRSVVATEALLPVGWRVAAPDWAADATEQGVYNAVAPNVYPGAIVEMHLDGPATDRSTALALPRLIDDLRERGYEFVAIGKMLQPCDAATPAAPQSITMSGLDVHGLHCMSAPSRGSTLIRILLNGDVVTTRGPAFDGWLPVECAGRDGWIRFEVVR